MGRRKQKQHPKKRTKAKTERAKGEEHNNQVGWKGAIGRTLSSGWVQNSGVAFLGAIIWLVVAMATKSGMKAAAISFACFGTAALWIFAVVMIRYAATDTGSIVINKKFAAVFTTGRSNSAGPFWIRYRSGQGDSISPIQVPLYLVLHNSADAPIKIASFRVLMQAKWHKWLPLAHVDAQVGQIFLDIR